MNQVVQSLNFSRALARLDHIGAYIARHNPGAAIRVIIRIRSIVESLPDHPLMGKAGRGRTQGRWQAISPILSLIGRQRTKSKF
ncbi:type II toxin-antitoxin system RelE/ParE family toxin [Rhizobium sp. K102]|uniref:type II toxin-antitoxin system RelE/ParE family toxin n=1 Tax=Rhizobium sp. K102 TaxID=2918527 RepID=UPI0031F32F56